MANIMKKNKSKATVLPSMFNEFISAKKRIFKPCIEEIDLKGLKTLKVLKADKLIPS